MRYREKLVRNSLFITLSRIIYIACNIILTPLIIHYVGLEKFGIWVLFSALTSYFNLMDMGVGTSFVKFLAQYYAKKDIEKFNSVANTGLVFNVFIFFPILSIVFLFRHGIFNFLNIQIIQGDQIELVFLGVLLILLVNVITSSYTAILVGVQKLVMFSSLNVVANLARIFLVLILLKSGLDLKAVLAGQFLFLSIVNIGSIFYAKKIIPEFKINFFLFKLSRLKEMFFYGIKLQASQLAFLVHRHADKFLVSHLMNLSSVTYYQVAQQVAFAIRTLTAFILPVVLPVASELHALSDNNGLKKLNDQGLKFLLIILLGLGGFVFITAHQIILFWLGSTEFNRSILLLRLFIVTICIAKLSSFWEIMARGIGIVEFEMRSSFLLVVVQLPLNYFLISNYGLPGGAYGVLAATLISQIYFIFKFRQKCGFPIVKGIRRYIVGICASAFITGIVLYFIQRVVPIDNFYNKVTGGIVLSVEAVGFFFVFTVLLILCRVIRKDDIIMISKAFHSDKNNSVQSTL